MSKLILYVQSSGMMDILEEEINTGDHHPDARYQT